MSRPFTRRKHDQILIIIYNFFGGLFSFQLDFISAVSLFCALVFDKCQSNCKKKCVNCAVLSVLSFSKFEGDKGHFSGQNKKMVKDL